MEGDRARARQPEITEADARHAVSRSERPAAPQASQSPAPLTFSEGTWLEQSLRSSPNLGRGWAPPLEALLLRTQQSYGNSVVQGLIQRATPSPSAEDHLPAGAVAPLVQRQPTAADRAVAFVNPTYGPAVGHLREYFRRQEILAGTLVQMKRDALDNFKNISEEAYNREAESSTLAIFSLALSLIPEAKILNEVFKLMTEGKAIIDVSQKTAKLIERATTLNEAVKAGVETTKGVGEAVTKPSEQREAASDARARGDFIVVQVSNLSELSMDTITKMWGQQDLAEKLFKPLKYAQGVDLENVTEQQFPYPTEVPKDLEKAAAEKFELLLYKEFYIDSGRAYFPSKLTYAFGPKGTSEDELSEWMADAKHFPDGVRERIKLLNGGKVVYYNWYKGSPVVKEEEAKRSREKTEREREARMIEALPQLSGGNLSLPK